MMSDRSAEGKNTDEYNQIAGKITGHATKNTLILTRGTEGFAVINKGDYYDTPTADFTNTALEGCFYDPRWNNHVAIEWKNGRKWVTRWGTWQRGGLVVGKHEALFFHKVDFKSCY